MKYRSPLLRLGGTPHQIRRKILGNSICANDTNLGLLPHRNSEMPDVFSPSVFRLNEQLNKKVKMCHLKNYIAVDSTDDSTVWKRRRVDIPILPALGQRNGDEIR